MVADAAEATREMDGGKLGRPIAVGRTAEIYAWGDGRVMKLYREGSSREYVSREARVSKLAHDAGLPAPAVFPADASDGLHEVDGRLGILFERVEGPTMLRDLLCRPWMVVTHSKALAALHVQLHSTSGKGLPDLRKRVRWILDCAEDLLPEGTRSIARDVLEGLPVGDRVCHGDFHPDNILLREGGPVIVDWGPASCGHPAADVVWTYLLYTVAKGPVDASAAMRAFLFLFRRLSLRVYLRTYAALTGLRWGEMREWLGVIAVLRLADRIPEERDGLLRLIERELGRPHEDS
jgi:Ser/Thr protein kinase RdoA (MazF antagonist)